MTTPANGLIEAARDVVAFWHCPASRVGVFRPIAERLEQSLAALPAHAVVVPASLIQEIADELALTSYNRKGRFTVDIIADLRAYLTGQQGGSNEG